MSSAGVPSSQKVLQLYRKILKEGRSLKYTDYEFFRRSIRRDFERQKDEVEAKVIKEQYEVIFTPKSQFKMVVLKLLWWKEVVFIMESSFMEIVRKGVISKTLHLQKP